MIIQIAPVLSLALRLHGAGTPRQKVIIMCVVCECGSIYSSTDCLFMEVGSKTQKYNILLMTSHIKKESRLQGYIDQGYFDPVVVMYLQRQRKKHLDYQLLQRVLLLSMPILQQVSHLWSPLFINALQNVAHLAAD
ncbi:hypothetical protein GOP47_0014564 [Adiantum capillus-veneris]|uniref:Uncharacterized protein n=1 Tax=Adiantum capillus-veneris TaxID=13818 RepID=A0A9D4ULV2_ADICA|nr:hypothetical protein GOP47_0014564 [Adiantum capillus-veneris]